MHQIVKHAKEVPAPGKYYFKQKEKILGCVKLKEEKMNILDNSIFLGQSTPAPYDLVSMELYKSPRS